MYLLLFIWALVSQCLLFHLQLLNKFGVIDVEHDLKQQLQGQCRPTAHFIALERQGFVLTSLKTLLKCGNCCSVVLLADFYSLRRDVETTSERVEEIRASACLQQLEQERADLELKAADSSFWDDQDKAQETLSALTDVKDKLKLLTEFKTQVCNSSVNYSPGFVHLQFLSRSFTKHEA